MREQCRLREDEQRGDYAERRVEREQHPHRPCPAHEARVERVHDPSVCSASSSTGPTGSSPPSRARKT